jgi:outer membrane receptor protein involved in Fe transport
VNYSTFGGNFSYKLGARWTPIRDITVRGTYSTAFRAPSISELYLGGTETDPAATDPCVDIINVSQAVRDRCIANGVKGSGSGDNGLQELTRQSGNPNLQAETAKSYTAGIVIQPQIIRGLSFTVDYYHTAIDNAIGFISTPYILQGCFVGGYQPFCDLVVRNNTGQIQYVSSSPTNQGELRTAGVDFAVRYALPTSVGRFAFSLDGTWLAFFDSTVTVANLPTVHAKGYYDMGAMPAWKGNIAIDYGIGGLVAGVVGRYVGTITECSNPYDPTTAQGGLCNLTDGTINPLNRQVSSYFQVDIHAGYTLSTSYGRTNFFAGITNLMDKQPPYIYSAALANSDPASYDYLGRYFYGRLQHTF